VIQLFDAVPVKTEASFLSNEVTGCGNPFFQNTPISTAFFSRANIQLLQNGIRAGVYYKSKGEYMIGPQNEEVLHVIMRAIFTLHHRVGSVEALNHEVLEYAVPQVYGEAQGHLGFLRDLHTLATPMPAPILVTRADKHLEFTPGMMDAGFRY
jgi:hypothetical protein